MKRALSIVGQTVLLCAAAFAGFIVGMLRPDLRVYRVVSRTATNIRTYDYNWMIAVGVAYLLLLLAGVLRRRIRTSWVGSTVALAITLLMLMVFTQIGIKETPVGGF